MSFPSENQYILTAQKFKKAARGLQRRLSALNAGHEKLPLQSVMQSLSQELFSMPYEEAKATILLAGSPLIRTNTSLEKPPVTLSTSSVHDITHELWRELTLALNNILPVNIRNDITSSISVGKVLVYLAGLKCYFPATVFRELRYYEKWFADIQKTHAGLLEKLWLETRQKSGLGFSRSWEGRSMTTIAALAGSLEQKNQDKHLSLYDIEEYLADLKKYTNLAFDETIPTVHRAGLITMLNSIHFNRPSQDDPDPKQNISTLEQFDYIAMEPLWLVNKLLKEAGSTM